MNPSLVSLLVLLALASCVAGRAADDPSTGTWTLAVGRAVALPGDAGGTIVLDKVDDSRCPIGVVCVWEGEATAHLTLQGGDGPDLTVDLSLHSKPTAEVRGLELRLTAVEPHPKVDETIDPAACRATVAWRRL
jgi:hypothetical protein